MNFDPQHFFDHMRKHVCDFFAGRMHKVGSDSK